MDLEGVEDLLFGGAETNEDFENLWNDDYDDDEMLDAANILHGSDDDDLFDTLGANTADAWLLSSPPLTPADMHFTPQHDASTILADDVAQSVDTGKRRLRDRCPICPAEQNQC
jgi:meiotic recombination protein SPO11